MKKQDIEKILNNLSKYYINEVITLLSLSGSIIVFLGLVRSIIYKSKSAQFYNVPSYLIEMDIYEYLYAPLLITAISIIWCLFLIANKYETNKFFKLFMILYFLPITAIFITLFTGNIYFEFITFFNVKIACSYKYSILIFYLVPIFTYIVLTFCIYTKIKSEKIKKIKNLGLILAIILLCGNIFIQFSLDPVEKKKYEILENEDKIVISLYQNNYIAMKYIRLEEGIEIDTSSYFLTPVSNQKIKFEYFKSVKKLEKGIK